MSNIMNGISCGELSHLTDVTHNGRLVGLDTKYWGFSTECGQNTNNLQQTQL